MITLEVLSDGPGDAPSETKKSSQDPSNLISDSTLARQVLDTCAEFEDHLLDLLKRSETSEPQAEYEKFKRAMANFLVGVGECLLYPIYRRHPTMLPKEFKGELP